MLVALALSGAGVFAVAGPAAAAPSDCPKGYHCTYSGYNYGNDAWQQPSTHKFLNCVDKMYIGWRTYQNVASSAYNNGNVQTSYLYSGVEKTGKRLPFARGTGKPDLGKHAFNDTAESGYFSSTLNSAGSALCL
ncbi:peptidase inhibitor family I36 protein [Microbacterium aurugineum]|uniref:peptidase inhibitor family I36 protein n=1 Tax=Microbacterium aurugineum TaxID=2851642 RepID=UPI0020BFEC00|nr:peptidase inhibitor family I36 protein [Microbacterium aurugineum]MCK8475647.1 peptidase inhibitor family I36 protein [Microbacterium aurugineum]